MPVLTCGSVDLYYEEVGAGPALLWIPGTGLRGRTWEQQITAFSERFRCISVDLRASGASTGAHCSRKRSPVKPPGPTSQGTSDSSWTRWGWSGRP